MWATVITAREKTLARDKRGAVGDKGVLVTGGLRGLLGSQGTGDVGRGCGDRRAWGRAGGTGPPGVLGGVSGSAGDDVSHEGVIETTGQVCTEPAEREASGAAPKGCLRPLPRHPRASSQRAAGSPSAMNMPIVPALVPVGDPRGAGAASGSTGLARLVSDGERLSNGRTGDWTERLGLVQLRSVA